MFKIFDAYTTRARLFPGLINCSPIIFFVYWLFHINNINLTAISLTTVLILAILYGISELFRTLGKKIEDSNYKKWGGKPTTILLSLSDKEIDDSTKKQLYSLIKKDFKIDLLANNDDHNIDNAIQQIITSFYSVKDKGMLQEHNLEYGFARNLAGGSTTLLFEELIVFSFFCVNYFQNKTLSDLYISSVFIILFLVTLYLKIYVYPLMIKDRAFRYARTLIRLYYSKHSREKSR